MRLAFRGIIVAVLMLCAVAGWRLLGQMQAERYAHDAPGEALQWRPHDPDALFQLAEQQQARQAAAAAVRTAQQLLTVAPLRGQAYRVLAQAADSRGAAQQAQLLFDIAERRVPRDLPTHAWLAQQALQRQNYPAAMQQLDFVLRQQPERFSKLGPVLVQFAQLPAFADALAATLRSNPPWRGAMLQALQTNSGQTSNGQDAQARVMQALQEKGGLNPAEFGLWLESLLAQGRWGEAYALWAGTVAKPGGQLPALYNGDFSLPMNPYGFNWRQREIPGVLLQVEPAAAGSLPALHVQFMDRGVPETGLEHPLLLQPGRYRLSMQTRTQSLVSELGLHWVIECDRGPRLVALVLPANGTADWHAAEGAFEIPTANCTGQRLRLINPVSGGAGQRLSGELWITRMQLLRLTK
jgi:hypothetical protein